jgi:FkbM family methyltransferase
VHAQCAGLGRVVGDGTLFRYGSDQTNSLFAKADGAEQFLFDSSYMGECGTVQVKMTTIDDFCKDESIGQIDLLKIDTQGYELEVLKGATRLLNSKSIGIIYTEVCFVRYYQHQPLFQDVYDYLYKQGYRLVALYESGYLTHYYQVGGNALFVHEAMGKIRPPTRSLSLGSVRISW